MSTAEMKLPVATVQPKVNVKEKERGQSLVEYALILFVVVTIGVVAFAVFQEDIKGFLEGMGDLAPSEAENEAAGKKVHDALKLGDDGTGTWEEE